MNKLTVTLIDYLVTCTCTFVDDYGITQTKLLSLRVPVINRNPIQIIRQVFMNNLRVASSIWLNGSSGKKYKQTIYYLIIALCPLLSNSQRPCLDLAQYQVAMTPLALSSSFC